MHGQAGGRSDAQLLRASARDPEAFGEFYDRHARTVFQFFWRRTACAHTAADLTAETFAQAFSSRRRFRDTGSPALAWLLAIGRHQLGRLARTRAVEARARRRLGIESIVLDEDALESLERLGELGPLGGQLNGAMAELSPTLARAVHLRVVEELDYAAVAARLGCSEGAARVRVSRGLSQLAERINPDATSKECS